MRGEENIREYKNVFQERKGVKVRVKWFQRERGRGVWEMGKGALRKGCKRGKGKGEKVLRCAFGRGMNGRIK